MQRNAILTVKLMMLDDTLALLEVSLIAERVL